MNIAGFFQKINPARQRDVYIVLIIMLVGAASFGLGRLSALSGEKDAVRIEQGALVSGAISERSSSSAGESAPALKAGGQVVASKSGKQNLLRLAGRGRKGGVYQSGKLQGTIGRKLGISF